MSGIPTRSRVSLAIAGAAGLLIGLGGGYLWHGAAGHSVNDGAGKPRPIASVAPAQEVNGPLSNVKADAASSSQIELLSADGEVHRKAMTRAVNAALALRKPAERMKRFMELMDHFRAGDIQAVVDGFREHDQKGRLFSAEYNIFMDLSGRVDGTAAMERIKTRYSSPEITVLDHHIRCMTAWAETAPSDAIKWWNNLEDGQFRDGMAKSIIAGIVKTDMPRALEYLKMFPEEQRSQHAGAFVRERLEHGSPKDAAEWLKSVDVRSGDGNLFQVAAVQTLMTNMVNVPPADKAAHLEPLLDQSWFATTGCLSRVMSEWAKKDTSAAANWLDTHTSSPCFSDAAAALTAEWRKTAPEAAAQWEQQLNQTPK